MKSPRIMYAYAGFLIGCGLVAFALSNFASKALTALIVPGACAIVMVLCGVMASAISRNRTVGMIGIHAGLALPLLFAIAFAMRAYSSWQKHHASGDPPLHLPVALAVLAAGSVLAFALILLTRPRSRVEA